MSSVQEIPAEIQDRNVIGRIETGERWLDLHWADGHQSRFHNLWLRDNCFCSECGETWTGRRYVMLTDFAPDIHPLSSELDLEGNLTIIWSGEFHRSVYQAAWLRRHCYSPEERNRRRHRPILWDQTLIEKLPEVEYAQVRSSESSLLHLYELLRDYGVGLVHGVPTGVEGSRSLADSAVDGTRSFAELFGVLGDSGYGEILNLSNQVDYSGGDVDEADEETGTYQVTLPTLAPVPPHNDEPHRYAHPGIKFLHCVEPDSEGGGYSIMVDGFRVAEDLREKSPKHFELLSTVPQTYLDIISEDRAAGAGYGRPVDFRGGGRAICLDVDGAVVGFRYHTRRAAPLDLPEALIEPMYAANYELVSRLNDPAYQLRYRLEAGDAIVFDNHRVLHAREGFRGRRHLRLFHVEREEFHSRLRLLSRRLGREDADWALPGGALG